MPDYNVERFSPVRARAMAENELMDIEQANRRNALMESAARRQEQQFAMEMQDREAQKQQALLAQHTDWIKNAIVTARRNPQVIPSLVSEAKQRGLLPPEVQTLAPADIEDLALHYGVAPQEAQKPEYRTVGDSLLQLGPDGPKVAYREPQRAPVESPVNKQLVTRPTGNGMVQDFAWNPRTSSLDPVGQPYKPEKSAADSRLSVTLRKEFEGLDPVKNYMTVLPLYRRAATAPNTRAGDISVIYALGKMFDPTSVVREGELILSKNAAPWLVKVASEANSQISGKGAISPETRKQIVDALKGQVDAMKLGYQRERERFSSYAPSYGVEANEIVGNDPAEAYSDAPKVKKEAPKLGQIVRGYRFKGGDPASQDSWVKVGK